MNSNWRFIVHPLVKKFEEKQLDALKNDKIVHFRVGDLLKVKLVVEEKGKKWVQTSEGICIKKILKGINTTFTIRRVEKDVAMMITFAPYLQDLTIEVLAMSKVRRARLYYLDRCSVKKGRLKALTHNQIKKRQAYESKENLNG